MEHEQNRPSELVEPEVPVGPKDGRRESWQKPALEKLALNEAQTGLVAGGDSEIFS